LSRKYENSKTKLNSAIMNSSVPVRIHLNVSDDEL